MCLANFAVGQRAARLHCNFPEYDFAEFGEKLFHIIGFADRNAARRNHHIADFTGFGECFFEQRRIIAYHAHIDHLATHARQHAVDRVAIAVVNLALGERQAYRNQFVAGGKKHHAQRPNHAHFTDTERGQQPEFCGANDAAFGQCHCTLFQILACVAHVLALHHARGEGDRFGVCPCPLLHDDRVAAFRHHAAGEDAHALACANRARKWLSRKAGADLGQRR